MNARRMPRPVNLPSHARDIARPPRPRNARKGRHRTAPRLVTERARGIATGRTPPVPVEEAIDWDILPVSQVLDGDFDADDLSVVIGHVRSMATTLWEEEGWLPG